MAAPRTTSWVLFLGSKRNKLRVPLTLGHELVPPMIGRIAVKTKGHTARCLTSSPPKDPQPKGQAATATLLRNLREVGKALHHNLSNDQKMVAGSLSFAHWRSLSSANHTVKASSEPAKPQWESLARSTSTGCCWRQVGKINIYIVVSACRRPVLWQQGPASPSAG
jgi:hypothetical protein